MTDMKTLTTNFGMPVGNDLNSMTAGAKGPTLMQDVYVLENLRISTASVSPKGLSMPRVPEPTAISRLPMTSANTPWPNSCPRQAKKPIFSSVFQRWAVKGVRLIRNATHGALP